VPNVKIEANSIIGPGPKILELVKCAKIEGA
jgi:hypothetical protein